jgi:hypothetical protein
MNKLSEYESIALNKLGQTIIDGKWSNDGLVQLIELAGDYLNLKTIPDYAAFSKLSYNGVKKTREIREIKGVKFVIDND